MGGNAHAQEPVPPTEPDSGGVVCKPGIYITVPDDCIASGPSQYLTELAKMGLTLPARPLPSSHPDPLLTQLPYSYFRVESETSVPIYSAPGGKGPGSQEFPPGFVYVSYRDRVEQDGVYYMMKSGGWIPGKGYRISEISNFQGLVFKATPRNSFGWAFEQIPVKLTPGINSANSSRQVYPFQVMQIYASEGSGIDEWYLIGPDQWVEGRKVARVQPNPNPPEGVSAGRWIEVDLAEQALSVYDNYQLVFATMVATGLDPFWTKPGVFQIRQKKEAEDMRNNDPVDFYYLEDVPWTMYYDGARALHGAYWRTRFGYPQSHGCVNLSVGDASWLFKWAMEGDWVYVHDPSGLTPTDPALYSDYAY